MKVTLNFLNFFDRKVREVGENEGALPQKIKRKSSVTSTKP